tara:strand:- start:161 stop:361 length:201 start_codon:yes stop_codon:yes gene_type:complete
VNLVASVSVKEKRNVKLPAVVAAAAAAVVTIATVVTVAMLPPATALVAAMKVGAAERDNEYEGDQK